MTVAALEQRAWIEQIMGLPISIHLRGNGVRSGLADERVAAIFTELRRVDEVLSPYRDSSDLSRWDRGELGLADADPMLAEVVRLCELAHERTEGWFDPCGLPDPRDGHPRYDPSGLVKGWAAERATQHLSSLADIGWCMNAGGDVLVHSPDDQPPWRVGIEHPGDPARIIRVVERRSGAVATSGRAHRGNHIIDPYAHRPAQASHAVTVTGPALLWADVYATAAAARGKAGLPWLEAISDYEALIVTSQGLLHTTTHWANQTPALGARFTTLTMRSMTGAGIGSAGSRGPSAGRAAGQ